MMKRISVLMVVLAIICSGLFAAVSWTWDGSTTPISSGSASPFVPVKLDTSNITKQAEIGFTSTKISNASEAGYKTFASGNGGTTVLTVEEISLSNINVQDGTATTEAGITYYASWLIQSGLSLKVFLYAKSELVNDSDPANKIGWSVTSGDSTFIDCTSGNTTGMVTDSTVPSAPPNNENNNGYVYEHKPNSAFKNYGSVALTVKSESVWDHPADSYEADLYMVIVADGTGAQP